MHAQHSLGPKVAAPGPHEVNIGLLDASLAGAPGHRIDAPCGVSDLVAHAFDYWALGHIHSRKIHAEAPHWVVMPGMPQGRDIGEAGPKSATLLTVEDRQITLSEVPTAEVTFTRVPCDLSDVVDPSAVQARIRETLHAAAPGHGCAQIIRLSFQGATPLAWQLARDAALWTEQAQSEAAMIGDLWIEQVDIAVTDPAPAHAGPVAELDALMQTIAAEPGFQDEAQRLVAETLANLPPARRAALAPDAEAEAALSRRLAADGARTVLARIQGRR